MVSKREEVSRALLLRNFTRTVLTETVSIQRFVQVCCTQPAHLYGLQHRKGEISPGMDADIVVWYPEDEINEVVTNEMLHHDIDYTPFEGTRVTNWPR